MQRKIFAVLGVMPEPGGYAAAKFSRTPIYKSYQDWVMELTEEGAQRFYNSVYFQYGHASIADLAHVMVIFENISMPARHLLLDDQLIDAQSRSTRYVDYSKCCFVVPPEIKKDKKTLKIFQTACRQAINLYSQVADGATKLYEKKYLPLKPAGMTKGDAERIIKARSFDVARYLLPSAGPKSMGIIASGRTWERIITKFLSSPRLEFQQIGKQLQAAICKKQAFNLAFMRIDQAEGFTTKQKEDLKKTISGRNVALPTLVKYARSSEYPANVYEKVKAFLPQLAIKEELDGQRGVEMFVKVDPQLDFAATLFYRATPYSYKQILIGLKKKSSVFLKRIVNLAYQLRGDHDPVLREADTACLTFDVCMDIGGFRDLHRHRNCVHILKEVAPVYGFDTPPEIKEMRFIKQYQKVMQDLVEAYWKIEKKYPGAGEYVLPQATRRRFLMKISPWELQYIAELRTKPQGHISYREIAYLMYQKFAQKYPQWAKNFKVTDPKIVDFFKR